MTMMMMRTRVPRPTTPPIEELMIGTRFPVWVEGSMAHQSSSTVVYTENSTGIVYGCDRQWDKIA